MCLAEVDDLYGGAEILSSEVPVGLEPAQCYSVYGAGPLTRMDDSAKIELSQCFDIIERVLNEVRQGACHLDLFRPAKHTDPVTREDVRPYEVYAKNLAEAATSIALFAFVEPPCLGVGEEVLISAGCGIQLIVFEKMPAASLEAVTPFLREVSRHENPEELRAISRMVRGISLCPAPGLVRFSDRYSLDQNFRRFWKMFGGQIVGEGVRHREVRAARWKDASRTLLRRRRIVGLSRGELAKVARCHSSLIKNLEEEPLVFSALSVENIARVLDPLGYDFEAAQDIQDGSAPSALRFGHPKHREYPLGEHNYKSLLKSHDELVYVEPEIRDECQRCQTECERDVCEKLWLDLRERTDLPAAIYVEGHWKVIPRPGLESDEDSSGLLFPPHELVEQTSYRCKVNMPESRAEWKTCWEEWKKAQGC